MKKRIRFWAVVLMMLLAYPVASFADGLDTAFAALAIPNTALGVVDAKRTVRCFEDYPGYCIEANPVFAALAVSRGIRHSMTVKVAADLGVTAGLAVAMHRYPAQKKWIVAGYVANILVKGLVIRHNRSVMLELAKRPNTSSTKQP